MATNIILKKTASKKELTTKDLIAVNGLEKYRKKYKYYHKTFFADLYNDNKALEKMDEEVNSLLRTGNWQIKHTNLYGTGTSGCSMVYTVLLEYKGSDRGGILQ